MKICSKCGKELPLDNFSWKNKSKKIYQSRCKSCQRIIDKEYYLSNPARRASIRERAKNDMSASKQYIKKYKQTHPCVKCGENRYYVLDFHHIDNNKERELSQVKTWSISKIQQEIDKCAILCANCHRDFHWQETNNGITFQQYIDKN